MKFNLGMINLVTMILGGCLSGAIGFVSAYMMSLITLRRTAGDKLRNAFAPELAFMRRANSEKSVDIDKLLKNAMPRHEIAIEEYRSFIPRRHLFAYQAAWKNYYEMGGSVRFFDYSTNENGPELFVERVENIMRFTRPGLFGNIRRK